MKVCILNRTPYFNISQQELPSRMEDEDIEELARQLYVQEGHDKNDVAVILGKEYVPHRKP